MSLSSGGRFRSMLNSILDACCSCLLGLYVPCVARLFFIFKANTENRIMSKASITPSSGHKTMWYIKSRLLSTIIVLNID